MPVPKSRVDVWKPKLKQVDGVVQDPPDATYNPFEILIPEAWVPLETPANLITNQKRANAVVGISIQDSLYNPRKATLRIANKCNDYRAIYNNESAANVTATTYSHTYNNSDGIAAHFTARRLPRNWGVFTNFFFPFQYIRIVDLETNLVTFSGRIYKIDKKYEDGAGSIVVLECKDALEELNILSCKSLARDAYFLSTARRSSMVKFGLQLAFNYHADNVKPVGGASKSQRTPLTSDLGSTYNVTTADAATSISQNSFRRFESSITTLGHSVDWKIKTSGAKSLLAELTRLAIAEPHTDETADDQFGYDFFVDSNIGMSNLSATVGPPAAQFNYVRRGNRLAKPDGLASTQDPAEYGLTIHFPIARTAIAQGHKYRQDSSTSTQVAKKMMHRAFSFGNPHDEMFTHGILTYNARKDSTEHGETVQDQSPKEKIKKFEVIWVNHLSGQFTYLGKNIDDEWKKTTGSTAGVDSAEELYAFEENGTTALNSGNPVCRVQYQSNAGNSSTTADYHYLLISDLDRLNGFPTANASGEDYVILKGAAASPAGSGITCRFNASERDNSQLGRPSIVWNINKEFNMVKMNLDELDELRVEMASKLAQSSAEIRRGTYQMTKAPYYWYDAQIKSTGSTGTLGQRLSLYDVDDSSENLVHPTKFGFREGMLVHKMNSDFSAMVQASNKNIYGYCFNMTDDSHIDVDLTEGQAFNVDDNIRLFIPIRAGDMVQVDNVLADVLGEHVITEIEYNEYMGPITQIQSIGANEARKAGAILKRNLWTAIGKEPLEERINPGFGASRGNQFAKFSGTFTATSANQIDWTAGDLTTVGDGTTYQIAAGNTSAASPIGLGSSGMTGTNMYVMYIDPLGDNPDWGVPYNIKTVLYSAYKQDSDNIKIATVQVGDPLASMNGEQVKANGDGSPLKVDGGKVIHNESMTSVLLKKGARAWTTTLDIDGTAFDAIEWDAAQLVFANGDTVTLNAGSETGIAAGTHYMFINGVSGSLTPGLTTSHGGAIGDAKILLATVTVSTATDGDKPTIFPFNGKKPTISAVVLAGDLILADHIRTGTISADRFTSAAQASITEKTITHVGNTAPSSPRTMDIWFDTDPQPTVIKVWNGSSWALQNSNSPEGGGGATVFRNDIDDVPNTANTNSANVPSVPVARYDLWMTNDTNQLYQALHATTNDSISTGEWTLKNDADAINYAETGINGGLITTERIKLFKGGTLNQGATGNAFETTSTDLVDTGRNTAASIGSASTGDITENITIEAKVQSADLHIYAGDVVRVDSEEMYVYSGSATTMTIIRGWHGTSVTSHNSGRDIHKIKYSIEAITNPHIIMDNAGITGYSDAYTPEFQIRATDGKATFANGKIVADCTGLLLTSSGSNAQIKFYNEASSSVYLSGFYSLADTTYWAAADGKSIWIGDNASGNNHDTDTITLVSQKIRFVNEGSDITTAPAWKFPSTNPTNNQLLKATYVSFTNQINLSWTDSISLSNGSLSAPSLNFSSVEVGGNDTGLIYFSEGSYEGVQLVGNGQEICTAKSNGSNNILDLNAHIDMNANTIYDCNGFDSNVDGTESSPIFTWDNHQTTGMYYDSGVAMSHSGDVKMKWKSDTTWSYQVLKPTGLGIDLGGSTSTNRWATVFCSTLNESSDVTLKENMVSLTKEKGLDFITSLNPIQYNMIDDSEIHTGFTAQHIKEKVLAQGYTEDFGLYTEEIEEDGTVSWGLVYRDLIAPLVASIKELKDRIEVLEGN